MKFLLRSRPNFLVKLSLLYKVHLLERKKLEEENNAINVYRFLILKDQVAPTLISLRDKVLENVLCEQAEVSPKLITLPGDHFIELLNVYI